jgi:hypothetical protein
VEESLGLLLLPRRLEEFELAEHARSLLAIPRVVALEPGRVRTPRALRDAVAVRQGRRLKLPGSPRLAVLYHPRQYPLARVILARWAEAELWYLRPDVGALAGERGYTREELLDFDELARARAARIVCAWEREALSAGTAALRERLLELGIISPRAFMPTARHGRRP